MFAGLRVQLGNRDVVDLDAHQKDDYALMGHFGYIINDAV